MNRTMPIVNEVKANQAEQELNLENLIKNYIEKIDKCKEELKQQREMLSDSFTNNPTYREHDEKVKEANKARLSVKNQIAKQPSVAILEQKVKDLRFDLKEFKKTLSGLLLDYKQQTGATQLELFNGQTAEIVESAKLVIGKTDK